MPRVCTSATVLTPFGHVRLMTTHLEFYSPAMRLAQAHEIIRLHAQGCALAKYPPLMDDSGGPFQAKPHTEHCIITGDFNFEPDAVEYAILQTPHAGSDQLVDAWTCARPDEPHAPTFRLHDRRYGPVPITCDFMFVSTALAHRVKRMEVDMETRASDHQPVLLELE